MRYRTAPHPAYHMVGMGVGNTFFSSVFLLSLFPSFPPHFPLGAGTENTVRNIFSRCNT